MKKITKIKFGLISPEQIKQMAVKEITKTDVYDADGYPVEDGVMDSHLGVIDPGMVCATCGGRAKDCKGHFGYIELAKPVVHVLYVKKIRSLLRFTCSKCQASLIKDEKEPLKKNNLLTKCPKCGAEQEPIKLEKPYFFYEGDKLLNPEEIRRRLENIDDSVARKLGMRGGRPEWLVLTRILVPPVTIRPSITLETGERSEDDLTHKLVDIIRINQRLKNNLEIGAPEFIIEDLWELLQYHVSTFFNNDLTGVPPARHRSGRALKSLMERLEGKEGRFRQNLIGKRANFSARTVISPDPNIDFDEVGVPEIIAKELTVPVTVRKDNIEQLKKLIKNGENYPGANYVIRKDGGKKKITSFNTDSLLEELKPGYIVERQLMDGDIVLFNRQPSLHRMSIMAHRAKIMPYRTFRLNLIACSPYNADFDGDEMNLHVPQTQEAIVEAKELLKIDNHIKSPKFGGPIIGFIQDHISGLYLLSKDNLSREDAFNLLVEAGLYEFDLPEKEIISGKDIISMFIPKNINMTMKCSTGENLVIKNGKMISGVLDSKSVGSYGGELINQILIHAGKEAASEFLNKVSKVAIKYLTKRGFSISTSDLEVSENAKKEINAAIEKGESEAEKIVDKYESGELEAMTGKTRKETLETLLALKLRSISNDVEKIIKKDIGPTSARIMAESGARGSITNLSLMAGLMGQETVLGQRISRGFSGRTTSHFKKGDLGPAAHGFVSSSIMDGLKPVESFFDIMSQREGLMDTSLRTRTSGYMYRRISNALQDLRVEYDGSVRTAAGTIVQYVAGEDGIDPAKSDKGKADPEKIESMKFEPAEAIGVVAAQSIAEPATQMTLETYHVAGAAKVSVTLGLPRLIEIIDARKNPKTPSMKIYLEKEYKTREKAKKVASEIKEVIFEDLVSQDTVDLLNLAIEIILDENIVKEYNLDSKQIKDVLDKSNLGAEIKIEGNKIVIKPKKPDYDLGDLQKIRKKLWNIHIKGIKGISQVVLVEENDGWTIETAGTNLKKVREIEGVDAYKTTSNDIFEIQKVLGIEAARNAIIHEIQSTLKEQGIYIDVRWILLVADIMTLEGKINGATRYGIVGAKSSVLARASFEETKKHLTNAAIKGQVDHLNSVVENVILGQIIPVGTGVLKLRAKLPKQEIKKPEKEKKVKKTTTKKKPKKE